MEHEQRACNEPLQNLNNVPAVQGMDPSILNAMKAVHQARKRRAIDTIDGQLSSGGVHGADGFLPVSAYVEFQKVGDGNLSTIDGVLEVGDCLQNMSVNSALLG